MALLKGITVTLYSREEAGTNELGETIYEEYPIEVENVLVQPASSTDIINSQELYGKKIVYNLAIPKGDGNDWEDCYVEFFDQRFHVFGFVEEGIEDLIPLDWHKKVMVERYE